MEKSKRHHYIPKFIIKGFTDDNGKIAVFNKDKMAMEPRKRSPKQIFFEWDRNTFEVNNEITDFVEKLFGFGESKFAPVYNKITEEIEHYDLTPLDMFHVIHYIGVLHACLPINDNEFTRFIKNSKKRRLFIRDNGY